MKRQLLVEVDCGEKTCAPCMKWRDNPMAEDPQLDCGVFNEPLQGHENGDLDRCTSCLAADRHETQGTEDEVERIEKVIIAACDACTADDAWVTEVARAVLKAVRG